MHQVYKLFFVDAVREQCGGVSCLAMHEVQRSKVILERMTNNDGIRAQKLAQAVLLECKQREKKEKNKGCG